MFVKINTESDRGIEIININQVTNIYKNDVPKTDNLLSNDCYWDIVIILSNNQSYEINFKTKLERNTAYEKFLENNPSATWKEIFEKVNNHYYSYKSMCSALSGMVNK